MSICSKIEGLEVEKESGVIFQEIYILLSVRNSPRVEDKL